MIRSPIPLYSILERLKLVSLVTWLTPIAYLRTGRHSPLLLLLWTDATVDRFLLLSCSCSKALLERVEGFFWHFLRLIEWILNSLYSRTLDYLLRAKGVRNFTWWVWISRWSILLIAVCSNSLLSRCFLLSTVIWSKRIHCVYRSISLSWVTSHACVLLWGNYLLNAVFLNDLLLFLLLESIRLTCLFCWLWSLEVVFIVNFWCCLLL